MQRFFYFQYMKRNLLLSFLSVVTMIIVMRWQGSALVNPQSPKGIIDLEFAKTPERLLQLKLFWNYETVLQNIYLDFLFILSYVWFLATACKAVNNRRSAVFSALAVSAGAFDLLENFLMILVWNGRFKPSVLQMVYYVAAIKFLLAGIVIGFLVLSLFGLFKRKPSA
jgi:hypothetical protein